MKKKTKKEKVNKNLEKLKNLTEKLPVLELTDLIENRSGTNIEYTVKDGTLLGFGLYSEPKVAVQRTFMSKGSTMEHHTHNEKEYGVIYKGKSKFTFGDNTRICDVGDWIYFEADQEHSCFALEDTWMIFITVPAEEGYPDA